MSVENSWKSAGIPLGMTCNIFYFYMPSLTGLSTATMIAATNISSLAGFLVPASLSTNSATSGVSNPGNPKILRILLQTKNMTEDFLPVPTV
jgi:hypothetical protein